MPSATRLSHPDNDTGFQVTGFHHSGFTSRGHPQCTVLQNCGTNIIVLVIVGADYRTDKEDRHEYLHRSRTID
jgi:hypothetical protein